jgi:hypothetical protein
MQQALNKKIADLLQIDAMPEAQQAAFFERVGAVVLESALNRLLMSLTEDKAAELELYLDTHDDSIDLFTYLTERYPMFEEYIEEEAQALQQEILDIMS